MEPLNNPSIRLENQTEKPRDIRENQTEKAQTSKELALEIVRNKTCLCFEGGGVLGAGHAGALVRLHEIGGLRNIKKVVGSSVGSIIALGLACGASATYIKNKLFRLDLSRFKDGGNGIQKLFRFLFRWGWHKGDEIEMFAGEILEELSGDPNITFQEAHRRYGIHLTITYLSLRDKKTKYADHINTPDLEIKKAARWSSTIPYFYKAYRKRDFNDRLENIIVDGGVADNYPMHVLHEQGCSKKDILGFKLVSSVSINKYHNNSDKDHGNNEALPTNIKDYSFVLLEILREQALRYHVEEGDWKLTCKINIGEHKTTDFNITEEDKLELYTSGLRSIDHYIEKVTRLISEGKYPLD